MLAGRPGESGWMLDDGMTTPLIPGFWPYPGALERVEPNGVVLKKVKAPA